MSSIQEKMDKFQFNCYEIAKGEAEKLAIEIEEKIDKNIKNEIKVYREESNMKYEKKANKLEQNYNCEIYDVENKAKHAIIEAENTIKQDLKDDVIFKIKEFVKTNEYKNFLIKNIKESINGLRPESGDIINICITQNDFNRYHDEIKDQFGYDIKPIPDKNIGGALCINESKKISINNTLKILIEENF